MLSIIIPTFNEEKYLPYLLESLKKQTFQDFEIIIADAFSSDRTRVIAQAFGCKIVDGGLPACGRNNGARASQNRLLLFLDADNIYLADDFLEKLISEFQKKDLDICSFPIYPKGNWFDKIAYSLYNWWVNLVQKFSAYASNALLVKKEIFEKINGFDKDIKIGEDHDFAKRAAKVGRFGFLKDIPPIITSDRRFQREGRIKTYLTYILAGIYMALFGPIKKDIFKYRFNCYNDQNNNNKEKIEEV